MRGNLSPGEGWGRSAVAAALFVASCSGGESLAPERRIDVTPDGSTLQDADGSDTDAAATEPPFVDLPENLALFPFFTIEAEYDRVHERIVLIAKDPPALHVYDPETHRDEALPLSFRPSVLSVAHDGARAVVGGDRSIGAPAPIALISLPQPTLIKTCTVNSKMFDIVLGPGEVVYAFPEYTADRSIHAVRLSDCAENPSVLSPLLASDRQRGLLSPDGTTVYMCTPPGPSRIHTVAQSGVLPKWFSEESVIDACHQFWLTDKEERVVTACGLVYQEGTDHRPVLQGAFQAYPQRDLELKGVVHSATIHRYAAVGTVSDSSLPVSPESLRIYGDADLKLEREVMMPTLRTPEGWTSAPWPRFVMQKNDGSRYYVDAAYLMPNTNYVSALVSIVP